MTGTTMTTTAPKRANRGTGVIWLLLGAAFVTMLNETVMSVALPHLVADLDITLSTAQWTTTAFMLTMAVVIPTTGWVLQRFTTRQVFLFAMTAFTIGTVIGALAPDFSVLLFARVVQAVGTAMMMPLLMTTIMNVVPAHERGRFMGRITIVMAVAPALGPALSGFILSTLSWHFLFWTILPVAIIMAAVGALLLKNVGERSRTPLDVPSLPLAAIGFGGLVYGISTVGGGPEAPVTAGIVALLAGVIGLAMFVWRQIALQRTERALLDLRTFRSRSFSLAAGLIVVMMAAMFGAIILLPLYLQNVLRVDAATTGLLLLPGGLVMGVVAPLVGRLFDKYGPRPLVIPGAIFVSAVLWAMTFVDEQTPPAVAALALVGISLGVSFMMTPLMTSALGSLGPSLYSHGSAIVGTVQQVAGAIGTTLFVSVLAFGTAQAAGSGVADVAAQAHGVSFAFTVGAALSLIAVVGSFFVRGAAPVASAPEKAALAA
ncbi:MDR family MFS transporter [Microbacterium sp. H1-D42]|uniref:MDR family MFS transporter n=1 Tax=Microbacterium sp. H1-D42 TaxID=2925844 RepID=UPI001F534298|nr:MDR family MFS transporter [Microbacterium sp. H1-D42]UNK71194.1 DHA2 family efflux MFS transporter permease subunit [Microbacterium sp. H1-D42]